MDEIWLDEDDVDWDNVGAVSKAGNSAADNANGQNSAVKGVPRESAFDNKKRFSFGLSDPPSKKGALASPLKNRMSPTKSVLKFQRRSISQPVLEILTSSEDEAAPSIEPLKKTKRMKNSKTQKPAPSSLPSSPVKKTQGGKKKEKETAVISEFHAVYCLVSRSQNRAHKGRCYIGYTKDTNRRIKQHNGGKDVGGAKKTDGRGPWDMVFCVEGFPNQVSGLRFEWASQNPDKSRVLKDRAIKKEKKETPLAFRVRVACHLINSEPWKRLALSFRWLIPSMKMPFPTTISPPEHVKVKEGLLADEKERTIRLGRGEEEYVRMKSCHICDDDILRVEEMALCIASLSCVGTFHLSCLAKKGLEKSGEWKTHLFPVKASCPVCGGSYRWGDVVRAQHDTVEVMKSHPEQEALEGMVPKKKIRMDV